MSFPKAKLHRFNEETTCAPPPGTYDPKLDSKVKGVVFLDKSKRFPNQQCSSSSLETIDKPSSQITFRTPQMKRKIHLSERLSSLKDTRHFSTGSSCESLPGGRAFKIPGVAEYSRSDYRRLEQELSIMAEKHQSQILKLNSEIDQLKEDLSEVKSQEAELLHVLEEKNALEVERKMELLEVKKNLDTITEKIKLERIEHTKFINELHEEISQLQAKKEDLEGALNEKLKAIIVINDKYIHLENEVRALREENERYKEDISELSETNKETLNNFVEVSDKKVEELDLKLRSKVHDLKKSFDDAQEELQSSSVININSVYHEFESITEPMKLKMEKCLAQFEELKKIVSDNENNFSKNLLEIDERCRFLFRELCKVEGQRDDLLISDLNQKLEMEEIKEKSDKLSEELFQYKEKCRKYEIALSTMQDTIRALSQRLEESETEVEHLSEVKADLESQKRKLEEKKQQLTSDIALLRESMEQMELDIIKDVTNIKEHIGNQLEMFKFEAAKQVNKLNEQIHDKQCAIDMLLQENAFYKNECGKKDDSIRCIKEKMVKYAEDNSDMKINRTKMEEEFSERITAQRNLYNILNNRLEDSTKREEELKTVNSNNEIKINSLKKEVAEWRTKSDELGIEVTSLRNINSEHESRLKLLENDIESSQKVIKKKKEIEIKLRKQIEELESDLVLEKEKNKKLKSEKEKTEELLEASQLHHAEKSEEMQNLVLEFERSLRNAEEKIAVTKDANSILEIQLRDSENKNNELKNDMLQSEKEFETRIRELQQQLLSAKERIKSEIPSLQQDNISKAQNILDLTLNIDSLNETIANQTVKITCLDAERGSLNVQLEDTLSKVSHLEKEIHDKKGIINNLTNQVNLAKSNYEDAKSNVDTWFNEYSKVAEELKQSVANESNLLKIQQLNSELQEQLNEKNEEIKRRDKIVQETMALKEEVEVLRIRIQVITEEKDKVDKELADLMGHQNIHQKIKHVNQLKQAYKEVCEKAYNQEIEMALLKKKLEEYKENSNILSDNVSKSAKKKKNPHSPAVLRDRNCQ